MTGPYRLGLTGSIGMGKSTTARMFADEGVPVWDADAAVHALYAAGGSGAAAVARICPPCVTADGVDRPCLAAWIAEAPDRLPRIEAEIHPLVAADRARFAREQTAPVVLFDIPLLFETDAGVDLDGVAVASAPPEVQRDRVLARPGMTPARLDTILARQMPDADKRARADWVIDTTSLDAARDGVHNVLRDIRDRLAADARDRAGHGDDGIRSRDG